LRRLKDAQFVTGDFLKKRKNIFLKTLVFFFLGMLVLAGTSHRALAQYPPSFDYTSGLGAGMFLYADAGEYVSPARVNRTTGGEGIVTAVDSLTSNAGTNMGVCSAIADAVEGHMESDVASIWIGPGTPDQMSGGTSEQSVYNTWTIVSPSVPHGTPVSIALQWNLAGTFNPTTPGSNDGIVYFEVWLNTPQLAQQYGMSSTGTKLVSREPVSSDIPVVDVGGTEDLSAQYLGWRGENLTVGSTFIIESNMNVIVYRTGSLDVDFSANVNPVSNTPDVYLLSSAPSHTASASSTGPAYGSVGFYSPTGGFSNLTSVPEDSLPATGKPTGLTFLYGLFSWNITGLIPGETITVNMTFPAPIPPDSQYWTVENNVWANLTSLISHPAPNTLTLTITDGGFGDADGNANGQIIDPGGPAIPNMSVKYGLIVEVLGSGTTNATGTSMYDAGETVSVKPTPDEGWELAYWLLNGSNSGIANPYTLTMNGNVELTAVFVPIFVVPVTPVGTLGASTSMIIALLAYLTFTKRRARQKIVQL